MVKAAITSLKEKKGSSLIAIKKYIEANYKGIDMKRHGPFIRRFLKKAVADGALVQIKGSYKMEAKPKAEKKATKPAAKKAKTPKPRLQKSLLPKSHQRRPRSLLLRNQRLPKSHQRRPRNPLLRSQLPRRQLRNQLPRRPQSQLPRSKLLVTTCHADTVVKWSF
jgi:hypothetical protein